MSGGQSTLKHSVRTNVSHGGFTSTGLNVGEGDAVGSSYLLEVQVFLCPVGECESQQLKMEKLGKLIKIRFP